mmetsp:Transcript_27180/g.67027  ORF Transcript_27180/g.67027 Transcript_27180/m.67027 type:complete len:223 (-) Transcript_27180:892-1560(-)
MGSHHKLPYALVVRKARQGGSLDEGHGPHRHGRVWCCCCAWGQQCAGAAAAVGAVSLNQHRRPTVVLFRLGVAAPRDRLLVHLHRPLLVDGCDPLRLSHSLGVCVGDALADVQDHDRGRDDQAEGRQLLAGSDCDGVSLRDTTCSQPPQLLPPQIPLMVPQVRDDDEPHHRAASAFPDPAPVARHPHVRGCCPDPFPGHPDPLGEPFLPQLAHHRPPHPVPR